MWGSMTNLMMCVPDSAQCSLTSEYTLTPRKNRSCMLQDINDLDTLAEVEIAPARDMSGLKLGFLGQSDFMFQGAGVASGMRPTTPRDTAQGYLDDQDDNELDMDVAMATVRNNGNYLRHVPLEQRENKELILTALQQDGFALQYVPLDLRLDKEVAMTAMKTNGLALQFAHPSHLLDKQVVKMAVTQNGKALVYAHMLLRDDEDIVMTAVRQDGLALHRASERLRGDADIVAAALEQNAMASYYADPRALDLLSKTEAKRKPPTSTGRPPPSARRPPPSIGLARVVSPLEDPRLEQRELVRLAPCSTTPLLQQLDGSAFEAPPDMTEEDEVYFGETHI